MTLYHGTTHDFIDIDVSRGKPYKDFGQGFYLSDDYKRAVNIALRNRRIEEDRRRAIGDNVDLSVFVYSYDFNMNDVLGLNLKHFKQPNKEWLKFIIANRMHKKHQHNYDIVIGATADDDTRTSIRAVMNAANGKILSDTALNLLIEMLEPNNLPEQYYFGTNKAVKLLKFKGRSEIK